MCFITLIIYTMARLLRGALSNEPVCLALFTSLTAFLAVGLVDSMIDETRLGFLFYLLLIAGLTVDKCCVRLNAETSKTVVLPMKIQA
jgi:hypothetical protein